MTPITYSQAREQIADGDLIALKRKQGWFWTLVRKVTRSEVTHTAVAIWLDSGLYAAEMNWGGNRLIPVSQYQADFDVYHCPVNNAQARQATLNGLRERIHYDFLDLLRIGISNLLNLRTPRDTGGMVCSAFSARIYREAGWSATGLSHIPSPGELAEALGADRKKLTVEVVA